VIGYVCDTANSRPSLDRPKVKVKRLHDGLKIPYESLLAGGLTPPAAVRRVRNDSAAGAAGKACVGSQHVTGEAPVFVPPAGCPNTGLQGVQRLLSCGQGAGAVAG
jgi:hypothetical protein